MSVDDNKENNIFDKDYLQSLSRNELVEIGQKLKIKNYSTSTKTELVKKIIKHGKDFNPLEENLNKEDSTERLKMENSQPEQNENTETSVIKVLEDYNDLESLSRKELVEIGQKLKIKKYSVHSKAELVKKIADLLEKEKALFSDMPKKTDTQKVLPSTKEVIKDEKVLKVETVSLDKTEVENESSKEEDLDSLQMSEIVDIARSLKVKNYSRLNKARLIKAIIKAKDESNLIEEPQVEKEIEIAPVIEAKEEKSIEHEPEIKKIETVSVETKVEEDKSLSVQALPSDTASNVDVKTIAEDIKVTNLTDKGLPVIKSKELSKTEKIKIEKDVTSNKEEEKEVKPNKELDVLFKPSKFPFGETHKEFLLEDETEIDLLNIPVEKDKVVILPVDPSKVFIYWDFLPSTIKRLKLIRVKELVVKVNDVTGIVYKQNNANRYWIKTALVNDKNVYVDLEYSDVNLCVEIGYVVGTKFVTLAISNTVYVPRGATSKLVLDTFVVVNYPEYEATSTHNENSFASSIYINKKPNPKNKDAYYDLNDYKLAENYNLKKMTRKMPVFSIDSDVPNFFANEYQIEGKKADTNQFRDHNIPDKLPMQSDFQVESTNYEVKPIFDLRNDIDSESIVDFAIVPKDTDSQIIKHENYSEYQEDSNDYQEDNSIVISETYFPEHSSEQIIKDIYHKIPRSSKPVKIYYEWVENDIPYRKVIYWVSDPTPTIHEKTYKISVGPSWVKEFIGGSERIKYLGSSDIYLGSSDINIGGSEMFIESSYRNMGASEILVEEAPDFQGASEVVSIGGASERNKINIRRYFSGSNFRKDFE